MKIDNKALSMLHDMIAIYIHAVGGRDAMSKEELKSLTKIEQLKQIYN